MAATEPGVANLQAVHDSESDLSPGKPELSGPQAAGPWRDCFLESLPRDIDGYLGLASMPFEPLDDGGAHPEPCQLQVPGRLSCPISPGYRRSMASGLETNLLYTCGSLPVLRYTQTKSSFHRQP